MHGHPQFSDQRSYRYIDSTWESQIVHRHTLVCWIRVNLLNSTTRLRVSTTWSPFIRLQGICQLRSNRRADSRETEASNWRELTRVTIDRFILSSHETYPFRQISLNTFETGFNRLSNLFHFCGRNRKKSSFLVLLYFFYRRVITFFVSIYHYKFDTRSIW